jgi:hypothetical protein
MARYRVNGKTVATAATIDHAIAEVWNPSTTKRIKLLQLWCFKQAAGAADEPVLRRTTAKGTPGSTVTPTSVNEVEQIAAPPSSFTLELSAFTVQPTLAASPLDGSVIPAAIGSGFIWLFDEHGGDGLEIPAGAGIALTVGIALAFPVARVTAIVED